MRRVRGSLPTVERIEGRIGQAASTDEPREDESGQPQRGRLLQFPWVRHTAQSEPRGEDLRQQDPSDEEA